MKAGDSPARVALAVFVALLAFERLLELRLSARHARVLEACGGFERGRAHFPLLVLLHVLFPIGIVAEVLLAHARPSAWWPLWAGLVLVAQALRFASIRALGVFWTARIWVVPGMPIVATGPYRWLAHPSYLAATIELLGAPLVFGAWRTAIGASILNAIALSIRIPAERAALAEAAATPGNASARREVASAIRGQEETSA